MKGASRAKEYFSAGSDDAGLLEETAEIPVPGDSMTKMDYPEGEGDPSEELARERSESMKIHEVEGAVSITSEDAGQLKTQDSSFVSHSKSAITESPKDESRM